MGLQFSLRQYLVAVILVVGSFYAGWLAKGMVEPNVYVSANESLPAVRGGGGHQVVKVKVPDGSAFVAGQHVGLKFNHADDPQIESSMGAFTVWDADTTSVSLLVAPDRVPYLLDMLEQPNCRLVNAD